MFERSMKKSLTMQIVAACTLGALASQASSCIAATLRALQWPSSSRQVAGLPETRDDGVFRDAFDARYGCHGDDTSHEAILGRCRISTCWEHRWSRAAPSR